VDEAFFIATILSLIISVTPDGNAYLQSTLCVLKPKGRIIIFNKFPKKDKGWDSLQKFFNPLSTVFGIDTNHYLSNLLQRCSYVIIHNDPSIGSRMYHIILLRNA